MVFRISIAILGKMGKWLLFVQGGVQKSGVGFCPGGVEVPTAFHGVKVLGAGF